LERAGSLPLGLACFRGRVSDRPERKLEWGFLGRISYPASERLQVSIRDAVRAGRKSDVLLFLEHPHVFTLGRNASNADVLADPDWLDARGVEVAECNRGGQVTYHGPGQLVGYPIIDLNPDRRDIRRYVHDLQTVLVATLAELGVDSQPRRSSEELGVWVENRKVASIGVHISRWVTSHGFALNVDTDLEYFAAIVPCGLSDVKMTSIAEITGNHHSLSEVAAICCHHFVDVFDRVPALVPREHLSMNWPIAS
jgi:lipoyl(octanoyl) transferase